MSLPLAQYQVTRRDDGWLEVSLKCRACGRPASVLLIDTFWHSYLQDSRVAASLPYGEIRSLLIGGSHHRCPPDESRPPMWSTELPWDTPGWATKEKPVSDVRDAEHDQPAPVPNDGPSMHDLVIKDIASRDIRWDLSVGNARHLRDSVIADLMERKQFGLAKYDTTLQANNGRDFLLDLYQELMDAAVYARGRLAEVSELSAEYLILFEVYDDIVSNLVRVRRLRGAVATE